MTIKTHNGAKKELNNNETVFYIQSRGNNSGRPLKKAIPNCWEVRTERSIDFEIMYIIFESKILLPFLRGSVIPFLSLEEYKKIVHPILKNAINDNRIINEHYLQIRKIEQNIANQDKIKSLLSEMKITLSHQVFKKIKTEKII
ncbi:DUF6943 family protein [Chryseobacterium sp.]|uniref:DUF6943 family protein n=1 Tax=Chryseobacterium sp. TaxID=1871047 RepID=UPI003890185E